MSYSCRRMGPTGPTGAGAGLAVNGGFVQLHTGDRIEYVPLTSVQSFWRERDECGLVLTPTGVEPLRFIFYSEYDAQRFVTELSQALGDYLAKAIGAR